MKNRLQSMFCEEIEITTQIADVLSSLSTQIADVLSSLSTQIADVLSSL